ncbi:M90 family metallopeptidase [Gilvimarinus sp. F26214L]|uniref:M90 family metallopeptidase n=1 Tax=Gilvimarinus sp. DZF01 TaxID=3461371 RepID=UPI0040456F60
MNTELIYLGLFLLVTGSAIYLFFWPRYRRQRILREQFPPQWEAVLQERLSIYSHLPAHLQDRLKDLIKVFLRNKEFVGCAGLQVTDDMRILIAAQACLLILNRPSFEYPELRAIYIYPSAFRAVHELRDELGLVSTETRDLLGESWNTGKVILAWDNVEHGVSNFSDGYNVVLHEFAHQLDHESGSANGAPLLLTRAAYKSWAYVMGREFERMQEEQGSGIIDEYGATDPAEFFAVATETFFEEPFKLHKHHRELFDQLNDYYQLDPRDWAQGG